MSKITDKKEKILLGNLPYWDPLVPPMGIAGIKAYLQQHGYPVKTFDLNVELHFKELYELYFNTLAAYIPPEKKGNFYNIGHDVLNNHLMAHINYNDDTLYRELVKQLIDSIFFNDAGEEQVTRLIEVVESFYSCLEDYIRRVMEEEKPTVVGFTVYKGTVHASLFAYRLVKKIAPTVKTVMGGGIFADTMSVGSPNYETFLEKTTDCIDKIMVGSGEQFLLKYLQGELPESQRVFFLKDFPTSPIGAPIIPDLSDFNLQHYPYTAATGSTSCPNKCSFCNSSVFYGEYRKRNPKETVAEMSALYRKYDFRLFFMTDALLNPTITEMSEELIANGPTDVSLYFDGYFRVDRATCNIDNTTLWRRGGFYRARLGLESGSQRILDMMQKEITVERTRNAVASLARAGIKATGYFVIGHPDETEDDFRMTLDLLEDIQNDLWQAECVPFAYYYSGQPGTQQWAGLRKLLYPNIMNDMLMIRTWCVDTKPNREEIYNRVYRFSEHCRKLGIPNPYSLAEIYKADERWKRLHKNAVPSLVDLMNKQSKINESRSVETLLLARKKQHEQPDFAF